MKRIPSPLVILLLTLTAVVSPAQAHTLRAPITVVDDQHTTLTFAVPPKRIISLAPNVTEILFSLGLGKEVVGVSVSSDYPKAALKLPIVYTLNGPNLEKILALKPDLLISAAIVPQTTVNKLRALHSKGTGNQPDRQSGILHDITIVGKAASVPAVMAVKRSGRAPGADQGRGLCRRHCYLTAGTVFYELDKTLYTVGRSSFMDSMITMAEREEYRRTASPIPIRNCPPRGAAGRQSAGDSCSRRRRLRHLRRQAVADATGLGRGKRRNQSPGLSV